MSKAKRYVLLPPRTLSAGRSAGAASTAPFFLELNAVGPAPAVVPGAGTVQIRVLDSIHEDGAKLVELAEDDVLALRAAQPNVTIAPVIYYELARARLHVPRAAASPVAGAVAATPGPIRLTVQDVKSGDGVEGATVVAFTDFANRFGAMGKTDAQGEVTLDLGGQPVDIERLYVYPPLAGYWGAYQEDAQLHSGFTVRIQPIEFGVQDCLRHFYGEGASTDGQGVTVGVVDTGVGPHPHLSVIGDIDNGEGHGSHVAGIIAGTGSPPDGFTGISPAASLRSYRVFSNPGGLAANFTIAKAIDQAVADGCDLVNLSLKVDNPNDPSGFLVDPVIQVALEDARRAGTLPIAAAGNDNRTKVDFPGRDPLCVAVSAFGREGTFPAGSMDESNVLDPRGDDPLDFIAAFSNVGPEVDVTGPGVGIVSTVPGGYGVMSGTSMACPAVVGIAARLLANRTDILNMPRDAARSEEIARLVLSSTRTLGFPPDHEGRGLVE
jgi:subtilisin